jgi:hypothetical protein
MRDTPDRHLQLDFQRRAPELCTDYSDLAARASSALHDARPTLVTGSWARIGVFFRSETWQPLTSDAPRPLPRRRVNDTGFNASSEHLRSPRAAASPPPTFVRRRLGPLDPAVSHNRRRARTSTTTLTDFCNRYQARAHWRTIGLPGRCAAFHDVALRLTTLRRRVAAPAVSGLESAPCKARKPAATRNRHPSRPRRPSPPWRAERRCRCRSRLASGPPRERTNLRNRARMSFAVLGSFRFYSTRNGRARRALRRLARASFRPGKRAVR